MKVHKDYDLIEKAYSYAMKNLKEHNPEAYYNSPNFLNLELKSCYQNNLRTYESKNGQTISTQKYSTITTEQNEESLSSIEHNRITVNYFQNALKNSTNAHINKANG